MSTVVSADAVELAKLDVLGRLDLIEAKLLVVDPELPVHMSTIHKTLLQYEELVHLLPDSKIHVYMAGMQKYKKLQLVQEATKARGPRGSKPTADDY